MKWLIPTAAKTMGYQSKINRITFSSLLTHMQMSFIHTFQSPMCTYLHKCACTHTQNFFFPNLYNVSRYTCKCTNSQMLTFCAALINCENQLRIPWWLPRSKELRNVTTSSPSLASSTSCNVSDICSDRATAKPGMVQCCT